MPARVGIWIIACCLLATAPVSIFAPFPSMASDTAPDREAIDRLVGQILKGLKSPVQVAVRPLGKGRGGLPLDIAERLDAEFLAAFRRRARSGVVLVERADLATAWEEAIEFADRNVQDLLREARADVLVTGRATAIQSGLELSYKAISLKDGKVGRVIAAARPVVLDIPGLDLDDLRFRQTLWRTAEELALAAAAKVDASDSGPAVDVVAGGGGGLFAEHVQNLARARIQAVLGNRAAMAAVPLNAAPARRTALHLSLEIWDRGDAVSITMKLNGAGVAETRVAQLDMALVPTNFLPLTRDGGKVGSGLFQAPGRALSGEVRSDRQTRAAARALARARVVASALGLPIPIAVDVGTQGEMVALRRMMERGIPHDEVWVSNLAGANGDVAVNLRALVRPVGGPSAPRVGIAFRGADMVAGESLKLLISAKRRTAHVAVFSWDAVDDVHLLYPAGGTTAMRVEKSQTLALPPVQGPAYGVAPMPGQKVSAESLIIIASAVPFETVDLALPPRRIGLAKSFRSQPVSGFFDVLAQRDLEIMSVRILDYRVRDAE